MEALTPEAAAKVVLAGLEGHQRRFSIVGRQGSGKSSTLDAVGDGLTERGRPFVRLGFSHDEDAPFSALIDLASQLSITSPDLLHLVRDPGVGWRAKLERVTSELVRAAPVVLFDEPRSPGTALGRGVFASCAHELSHAILSADKLRVVAGEQTHGGFVPSHAVVSVQPTSLPRQVLERAWSNKALEAAAAALMEQDATRLARYSPLELRLAAACVANGARARDLAERRWSPPELVRSAVSTDALRGAVARLALCRMGAPHDLAHDLAATPELYAFLRDVVFIESPAGAMVHDVIAHEALEGRWLPDLSAEQAHTTIAAWHRRQFEEASAANDLSKATRHEVEVVHHLTESRDAAGVLSAAVFFSEQYDLLGKELSLAKRYQDAVAAYERALAYDANDAYAHHYLAFNLDAQGKQASRVKAGYEKARALHPQRARYHGRYATFLVTVGRMAEADDAWAQALSELGYDDGVDPALLVRQLHLPLAALLLHRGELDFAERVLSAFPRSLRDRPAFRSLELRLTLLREVESETNVFPPALAIESRWKNPALFDAADPRRVTRYRPGRICDVSERGARVLMGERAADGPPSYRYVNFTRDELAALGAERSRGFRLAVGTFVEHLVLDDGTERFLSWQPQANALPSLELGFPPDRYIRAAASALE
ncbi:MAG TPA: hypothetical protein PLR99_04540 [Polyangiaceae bacterium]|nr:hypothetical protein [Polyangiaceae bacterium]